MSRQAGLSRLLGPIQWRMALVALLPMSLILTVVSLVYLRSSLLHSLELVSRSVAYSAEAAVLFRDVEASRALLRETVQRERLADARIALEDGELLAGEAGAPPDNWADRLSLRWPLLAASSQIDIEGALLAEVQVRDDFDPDADQFNPSQQAHLGRVTEGLRRVGIDGLRVEGHADKLGPEGYKLRLSERRAQAVSRALKHAGMAGARLKVRGHGSSKPIADYQTEAGRARNRRVALFAFSM